MPQQFDPLSGAGPFSAFLNPSSPVQAQGQFQPNSPQLTGYEHKGGIIGNLASQFLGGLSKGRAIQQQKSERDQANTLGALNSSIEQVQNSSLPDDVKQKKLGELYDMRGHVFLQALDGPDGPKKGKKDSNPAADFARHVVTSMLGPGKEKQAFTPEQIQASLFQTNQLLQQAPQLAAQNTEKADAPLRGVVAKFSKNGVLDTDAMVASQEFAKAFTANMNATGGQGTAYLRWLQAQPAEQAKIAASRSLVEERDAKAKRDAVQAKKEYYNSTPGRQETLDNIPGLASSMSAADRAEYLAGRKPLSQTSLSKNASTIKWAHKQIDDALEGKIDRNDPDVQAARDILAQSDAKLDSVKAGTESKRAMVGLRQQALSIAGTKAVNDIDTGFAKIEAGIKRSVGAGNMKKEDADSFLNELEKRKATAYQNAIDAQGGRKPAPGGGSGDGVKAPPPSDPEARQKALKDAVMGALGIGGTAAPPASSAPSLDSLIPKSQ